MRDSREFEGLKRFVIFLSRTAALAILLVVQPSGWAQDPDTRIALVIGNGYGGELKNPPNDARLIATTLRGVGFTLVGGKDGLPLINADQRAMKRAIQSFGEALDRAGPSAVGLFYYAGHGVQANGRNYLIPIGSDIRTEADLEIEAVSTDSVLAQMEYSRSRVNLLILDACRNNPYQRRFRSAARGLAQMGAPSGSLIAYATAPGEVAEDGPGANSPYTAALAEAMTVSGLTVEQALKRVRNVVMQATGNRQIPWESSSLVGDFFFEKAVGTAKVPIPSFLPAERELSESEIRELLTDYRLRGGDEDFISEIYFGPDQVARDQTFYPRNRRAKSLSRDYTWEVTSNSDLCLTLLRGVPGDEIGDRNCVKLTCKDGNTLILYSPRYARQMIWYRIGAEKQCP